MKKVLKYGLMVVVTILYFSLTGNAQVVVKTKPTAPVTEMNRAVQPDKDFIWIPEHWKWDKKRKEYIYVEGYWIKPKKNCKWVKGYWKTVDGGYIWIPGKWEKI